MFVTFPWFSWQAKDEVRDNLSRYHKCAKDTKDAKTKYEESQTKGNNFRRRRGCRLMTLSSCVKE